SRAVFAGNRMVLEGSDGSIQSVEPDGSDSRTLVKQSAGEGAISADRTHIAYLATANGSTQVFVANADGSHARNVSQLSGMDAAHPAWGVNGRLYFTASGRAGPEHTYVGLSLAEAANLLEAVLLAGILLVAVRRWRVPFGTFTVALTLFALAMATQTDAYYDAIPALITGLLADGALALWGDRLRSGIGFYAFAFALPAVFFSGYLSATVIATGGGTSWPPDMVLGSPLLAGIAGLLVAFCYEPPLPPATDASA
ncbi:MAG: hypothetical protein JO060_11595, partial [Candidatus Eremiobacteraeota bacterium]|nr:hypothetical protein [Candidatus Eremiobacteraeota bacterium]